MSNCVKFFFGFLVIFIGSSTLAEVSFPYAENGRVVMTGSCRETKKELKAIKEWNKIVSGSSTCKEKVTKSGKIPFFKTCEMDITECVPDHVKKYHNKSASLSGPNCFNHVLVFLGLLPHLRYSSAEEIEFYMREPYCKKVAPTEPKKPNDLVVMMCQGEPWHAYIRVSSKNIYSKNGRGSIYELRNKKRTVRLYDALCEEEGKTTSSVTYRCSSQPKEFLKLLGEEMDDLQNNIQQVERIECQFEQAVLVEQFISDQNQKTITDTIEALAAYAKKELQHQIRQGHQVSQERKTQLGILANKIFSLGTQIEIVMRMKKSPYQFDRYEELQNLLRESATNL